MILGIFAACGKTETTEETKEKTSTETEETKEETEEKEDETEEEINYLQMSLPLNDTLSGFYPTVVDGYSLGLQMLIACLVKYDVDTGEYVPSLAESVEISDDELVYTMTLKDAVWHDGTPVTADDVVFTFSKIITGSGLRYQKLSAIEGYETATDETGVSGIDDYSRDFEETQDWKWHQWKLVE